MPGSRPLIRSAATRPEPQDSVQPRWPWPALIHRPSIRVSPMIGVPAGLTGRNPAHAAVAVTSGIVRTLSPVEFAYGYMTRTGRVDHAEVKRRDPGLAAAYEVLHPEVLN